MKEIKVPIQELNFSFSRSSGPGGQNVNKGNTKVTLHWNLKESRIFDEGLWSRFQRKYPKSILEDGTVLISGQRFRSQARNIADCVEKLHSMLQSVLCPPKVRKATRPTRSSIERRIKEKKGKSNIKTFRKRPTFD